jgi:hypothetical protein
MNKLYSVSKNTFYPANGLEEYKNAGTLPDDLIEVTDESFVEFSKFTNGDLIRVAGRNGLPEWGVRPPLTTEDFFILKSAFMAEAGEKMEPLRDAVDTGMATEAEKSRLNNWKAYRVLLMRIDLPKTSDIIWPVKPT